MTNEPSTAALLTMLDERNRIISEMHSDLDRTYCRLYAEKRQREYLEGRVEPAASERISTLETEAIRKKVRIESLESKIRYMEIVPYGLIAVAFGIGLVVGAVVVVL